MGFDGCVWVACLGNEGGYDGGFHGNEVLASDRLRWAFRRKFHGRSLFGWHFVGVLLSS
jgi:hypothetical protein